MKTDVIDIKDVIQPMLDTLSDRYKRQAKGTADEWLRAIVDAVNEKCSKGWRFTGVVYDKDLEFLGALMFEESDKKWKYKISYGEDLDEVEYLSGVIPTIKKMGHHHATVYFFNITMNPIYFIAEELKNDSSTGKAKTKNVGAAKGPAKKPSGKGK